MNFIFCKLNCSDIISPYQKRPSKVFPLVLTILTNLWVFFKIPKIQKLYLIRAIFLRLVWTSKRSKWSLKSQKTRFFKAFLRGWKRPWKNVFLAILKTTSIFWMFKLLSKILHGYYQNWQNKWEYFRGSFLIRWNNVTTVKLNSKNATK